MCKSEPSATKPGHHAPAEPTAPHYQSPPPNAKDPPLSMRSVPPSEKRALCKELTIDDLKETLKPGHHAILPGAVEDFLVMEQQKVVLRCISQHQLFTVEAAGDQAAADIKSLEDIEKLSLIMPLPKQKIIEALVKSLPSDSVGDYCQSELISGTGEFGDIRGYLVSELVKAMQDKDHGIVFEDAGGRFSNREAIIKALRSDGEIPLASTLKFRVPTCVCEVIAHELKKQHDMGEEHLNEENLLAIHKRLKRVAPADLAELTPDLSKEQINVKLRYIVETMRACFGRSSENVYSKDWLMRAQNRLKEAQIQCYIPDGWKAKYFPKQDMVRYMYQGTAHTFHQMLQKAAKLTSQVTAAHPQTNCHVPFISPSAVRKPLISAFSTIMCYIAII
ncbi:hypothetical protein CYMTET_45416 [Cymbomonas tetramitiformis]|uniref:Uncharacterized protein n=1 Tax=Cymbomonas tetramitiformis TaxID=36881 RepID=A0AAE0BZK9_9CHLO|nr:hypothetical protein CYMTET_45416 [Cymbomonas tetramitiformis]